MEDCYALQLGACFVTGGGLRARVSSSTETTVSTTDRVEFYSSAGEVEASLEGEILKEVRDISEFLARIFQSGCGIQPRDTTTQPTLAPSIPPTNESASSVPQQKREADLADTGSLASKLESFNKTMGMKISDLRTLIVSYHRNARARSNVSCSEDPRAEKLEQSACIDSMRRVYYSLDGVKEELAILRDEQSTPLITARFLDEINVWMKLTVQKLGETKLN